MKKTESRWSRWLSLSYVLMGISLFLWLTYWARSLPFFPYDLTLTHVLQRISLPYFEQMMFFISEIGYQPYIGILILGIVVWLYRHRLYWEMVCLCFDMGLVVFLGLFFKGITHRARPPFDLVRVEMTLRDFSFPSGHVLTYVCLFGFIWYLAHCKNQSVWQRIVIESICVICILTIGLSRVYLGVHWPSDVVGGYLLGTLVLGLVVWVYRQKKLKNKGLKRLLKPVR